MEQGLCKLKIDKKKESVVEIAYTAKVEFINTFNPYSLPLSGFFNFDFFFSMLPNVISNNMPVSFL